LRVAEQAELLDLLSKDRLRLGLGRGLARREFAAFRTSMDESRERFDEVAPMIVNALGIRFIEGDGIFYQQSRTEIRPRPLHSFDGRIYGVASSEDSVRSAAKLGAHMVMFADRGPLHGLSEGSCVLVCGGSSAASKPDPLELRKRMPD
jgi:alkanesulfonate monooxygenase SsuD/methylene tetrahydromethanopterin reductase-like flavin-dependent oxidoreductase (luciferase family)